MTELTPSADDRGATNAPPRSVAPGIAALLPPGWVVLHMDARASDEVKSIVTHVMQTVTPDKRDIARARLRAMLQNLVAKSQDSGVWEVWLPISETAGIHIPASVAVAPLPKQPAAGATMHDTLLSLSAASAGSRAVTVGGVLAVRVVADRLAQYDETGELTAPATRLVNYIVSPTAPGQPWITFTASLFVPGTSDSAEIVEALEFLCDALMSSVSFSPKEPTE
ncbi:hypothetical protein I6E74_05890 [Salinibacterium sp. SWN139]|uniref:hypothetical protein n=1 Tax=Salinibacterium sp. SWN139 TaxID=2792055 RepID=UPI0018CEBDD5|nr:hypothetical protein [Salinibacterium sp. SWN139]MBH0053702.1 hypothetical protein [Salinibacterium sp. SWN139]